MRPTWNEISMMFHPISDVELLTLNCNKFQSLCVGIDGTSTPNIQYIPPHQTRRTSIFAGAYENISLVKWIKDNTGLLPFSPPGYPMYINEDESNEIIKNSWTLFVVDEPRKSSLNMTLMRSLEGKREINVRAISPKKDHDFASKLCGSKIPCISLLGGKDKYNYNGDYSEDSLLEFIDKYVPTEDSL